ncbi:hypothetical protein COLO4_08403 [Corchorus olitorius]|uniref:Uncharacterized protein n=1 Tax=Corchorus olitorius TaxID=93759 RepID=A0A1R3KG36_9ROSI|nr:hypothetical protein COLO4_08403 [Corchorus olitorius]
MRSYKGKLKTTLRFLVFEMRSTWSAGNKAN